MSYLFLLFIFFSERLFLNRPSDPYSDSSHERRLTAVQNNIIPRAHRSQSKIESSSSNSQKMTAHSSSSSSLKRSSSCSALPSNIKSLREHKEVIEIARPPTATHHTPAINIEEKENAILQQCFRNEGLSPECADVGCVFHGDNQYDSISRFPLPDHLNYPLNKYYKSESNLNRLTPLKKIRTSIRKLRSRTNSIHLSTPERYENYPTSDTNSETTTINPFNIDYFDSYQNLESNETILTRLGKSPCHNKKPWIKKLFKWGVGKSYIVKKKASKKEEIEHEQPLARKRSNSTRSIPEAVLNFLSKSQEKSSATTTATHEFEFMVPTTLQRANSMPSIAMHQVQKQPKREDVNVIYFNETGLKNLSSSQRGSQRNLRMNDQHRRCEIENNNCPSPVISHNLTKRESSSCQNVRTEKPFLASNIGHCNCCSQLQHQIPNSRFQTPDNHFQPIGCSSSAGEMDRYNRDNERMVQPMAYYTNQNAPLEFVRPSIVAPLDMKVSVERRAERRKICNMVFDTFV